MSAPAPITGPDGQVRMGVDTGVMRTSGGVIDPRLPLRQSVEDAFGAYDARRQGLPAAPQPGQPAAQVLPNLTEVDPAVAAVAAAAAAGQAPYTPPGQAAPKPGVPGAPVQLVPPLNPPPAVQPGQPGQPGQPAAADPASEFNTLDAIAASFLDEHNQPAKLAQLFDAVTHEINGQNYTLGQIVDGFSAQPAARQAIESRAVIESQAAFARTQERQLFDAEMTELSNMHATVQSMIDVDESPTVLAQLLTEDPAAYQRKIVANTTRKATLQASRDELTRKTTAQKKRDADLEDTRLRNESNQLNSAYPEWFAEGPARDVERNKINAYARGRGYSEAELSQITDHRTFLVLRDAVAGMEVREAGKVALRRAKDSNLRAPTSPADARREIPGNREAKELGMRDAFLNQARNGSIENTAAIFTRLTTAA